MKIKLKKKAIIILSAILVIIIVASVLVVLLKLGFFGMSAKQVGEKAIKYINDNQLSQETASLVSVSEESGLIKIKIKIGADEFDSYATKDGKFLFPQAFDMMPPKDANDANKDANTNSEKTPEQIIASITKTDKPVLEAFIVSRCPFGLQMQRMIADAVKNIPSLAQYVKVKYIGSVSGNTITAMHGEAEAKENLRQICMRDEQPTKYWDYVACQMKASGTENSCATSTGVDVTKLNACVADSSRGVAFAKKDFESADKYAVTGSPTLAINGAVIEEFTSDNQPVFGSSRSSNEIKTIICYAFNNAPSFCSTKLNTSSAASGFSATYATANSSGDTGANCQAAQ